MNETPAICQVGPVTKSTDMNVVIPVGPNRPDTLRWVLRTIWQHLSVDRVVIVGNIPGWVREVETLSVTQHRDRATNHRANIDAVLNHDLEDFVWWDDDHFILEDRGSIPLYNAGFVSTYLAAKKSQMRALAAPGEYQRAFQMCFDLCASWGYEDVLLPPHVPMPVEKASLASLVSDTDKSGLDRKEMMWAVWKAAYLTRVVSPENSPHLADPRHRHLENPDSPTDGFWATTANLWTTNTWIKDRYWRPSPYEAT